MLVTGQPFGVCRVDGTAGVGGVRARPQGSPRGMRSTKKNNFALVREIPDRTAAGLAEVCAVITGDDVVGVFERVPKGFAGGYRGEGTGILAAREWPDGGVYVHKQGSRARMKIKNRSYVAPLRSSPDLDAADLAEIRTSATRDGAVRVFQRLHESRAGGSSGLGDWRVRMLVKKENCVGFMRGAREVVTGDDAVREFAKLLECGAGGRRGGAGCVHGHKQAVAGRAHQRSWRSYHAPVRVARYMAAADLAAMGVSAGREDFGCALQRLHEFLACGDCSPAVGVHARMSGGGTCACGQGSREIGQRQKKSHPVPDLGPQRAIQEMASAVSAEFPVATSLDGIFRAVKNLTEARVLPGGGVYAVRDGWKASITWNCKTYNAPMRATRTLAAEDLAEIRAAACEDDVVQVVQTLHASRSGLARRRGRCGCVHLSAGGVYAKGNGWRASISLNMKLHHLPIRATRRRAAEDLAEIRAADSRDDIVRVINSVRECRGRRERMRCMGVYVPGLSGGVYAHGSGWRAWMRICQHGYRESVRVIGDLDPVDHALIRAVGSRGSAVRDTVDSIDLPSSKRCRVSKA